MSITAERKQELIKEYAVKVKVQYVLDVII